MKNIVDTRKKVAVFAENFHGTFCDPLREAVIKTGDANWMIELTKTLLNIPSTVQQKRHQYKREKHLVNLRYSITYGIFVKKT